MKKIIAQIKLFFTHNIGLKVISIILAALIWLAVVNVSDPQKTVTIYDVPITVTNEQVITDENKVYYLDNDSVNVTVSGKRSVVNDLTADDFTATASLKELSMVNAVPIDVSVRQKSTARKVTIEKQSLQTVTVSVEDIEKKQFDIETDLSGEPAEGYVVGGMSLSKDTVTVQAPESVIKKIARVAVSCDMDGVRANISHKAQIVLYNKRGEEISDDEITLSAKKVTVNVEILQEKEIGVFLDSPGTPASGYFVSDISLSSDTVVVSGSPEALADLDAVLLDDYVNVDGRTEDFKLKVDLADLLPKGVSVEGKSKIKVKVKIEKQSTKTYSIKTSDISIVNLDTGLKASIEEGEVDIDINGEKERLNEIEAKDFKLEIDLSGCKSGTVSVPVIVDAPEGTEFVSGAKVKVKISKK